MLATEEVASLAESNKLYCTLWTRSTVPHATRGVLAEPAGRSFVSSRGHVAFGAKLNGRPEGRKSAERECLSCVHRRGHEEYIVSIFAAGGHVVAPRFCSSRRSWFH